MKRRLIALLIMILSQMFLVSCDILNKEEFGKVEGFVLFENLDPAINVEILLGRTEFGGIGYPGNWKNKMRSFTDKNGFFSMTRVECENWAIILASGNSILTDYDVTPISYVIEVKKNKTHKIEFLLNEKGKNE
jgi:hypothetical protein